ncbi:hypothetical protein Tco_0641675 [Tanacetum coccineum]
MNLCAWLKQCFKNYHELDHKLLTMLQKHWWGIKDEEESSDDTWSYYSPIDEWENFNRTNTNDEIQGNRECFDEHEPIEDNDDDIVDLDDYLVRNDAPFIVNEEEEIFKERRCKLLGIIQIIEEKSDSYSKACILMSKGTKRIAEEHNSENESAVSIKEDTLIRALNYTQHPMKKITTHIPFANNLKPDEGSDADEVGFKQFSMNSPRKPLDLENNVGDDQKGFDEFCKSWWMKRETESLSNDGWSNYVPNDEWNLLEFERNNPIQAKPDCISKYGLLIDDNDFEYMCDYLLSKDEPFTVSNEEVRLEDKKCKLIGTPHEQIAKVEQDFDDWCLPRDNPECILLFVIESVFPDHNLWDVIVNEDLEEEPAPTGETSAPPAPKTAKQLVAKRNQERVKSILLLAIPDEYLLKFHNVADAKSL